jgi:hypothetical protein
MAVSLTRSSTHQVSPGGLTTLRVKKNHISIMMRRGFATLIIATLGYHECSAFSGPAFGNQKFALNPVCTSRGYDVI